MITSAALALALATPQAMPRVVSLMGKPIPAFTLVTSTGTKLTKKSLKGKVFLLDFWASWCGPCVAASPTMNDLHKKYSKKGLVVIGVNVSENPVDGNVAAAYKKKHGYGYTFTHKSDKFGLELGVETLPTFLLINQKGLVEQVFTGWHPEKVGGVLETRIKKLLKLK